MSDQRRIQQHNAVALPPNGAKILDEYLEKKASLPALTEALLSAQSALEQSTSILGAYTGEAFKKASLHLDRLEKRLLCNAWRALRTLYKIDEVAPVSDRDRLDRNLENPPELTPESMIELFGDYIMNPRDNQLRKLAEIFVKLDDAYKSHSKVKIGVKGLPKRIIMTHMGCSYLDGLSYNGQRYLHDLLSALQVFDGYGIPEPHTVSEIGKQNIDRYRGLTFKLYKNGNLHVMFDEHAMLQANRCLAEYYGDVLPDVEPDKSELKPDINGKAVSKDLQYYPTPESVARNVVRDIYYRDGAKILEPSCGCGRLIEAIYEDCENRKITIDAYEVHAGRAAKARSLGLANVMTRNFLEVEPSEDYDIIFMNPPFYGRHYQKHVEHALKFLKPGGQLVAILPATARYDHDYVTKDQWRDLPVGSFSESGTRAPTGYARILK